MLRTTLVCTLTILVLACSSGYKPESRSGGFTELELGTNLFEVRYQGNGFTRRSEASQLLMRRCAELALERGLRYFAIIGVEDSAVGSGADPGVQARIKLLQEPSEDPPSVDSLKIVEQTESLAGGKLSSRARDMITTLQSSQ